MTPPNDHFLKRRWGDYYSNRLKFTIYKKAYVNVEYYASRPFNFRKEVLQRSFAPCFVKTVLGRKD